MQRRSLVAPAVLLLAWGLLFAPQLFARRAFVAGDVSELRVFSEFSRTRWLERHERTHWNPYVFGGLPATASLYDSRPQYLGDGLLTAFDRLHGPRGLPPLAIPLVAHLAGMLAVAALARSLWRAGDAAAITAGLAWGLGPLLLVPFAFAHDAQLMAASLMPVVLAFVHAVCAAKDRVRATGAGLALALAVALELLAGHPQMAVFTALFAVLFAIERVASLRRPGRLVPLALAAVLGAALSAVVWCPALLYDAHSVRGGGGDLLAGEVAAWSLAPRDLPALVWPWAVGFGSAGYWGGMRSTDFPPYLGATVVALAVAGLLHRRGEARAAAGLFAITALGATLLALGVRLGPAHRWWSAIVPFWSSFRVAVHSVTVAALGTSLLAARGLEGLLGRPRTPGPDGDERPGSGRRPRAPGAFAAAGAIVAAACLAAAALAFTPLREAYVASVLEARPRIAREEAGNIARRAAGDLAVRGLLAAFVLAAAAAAARAARVPRGRGPKESRGRQGKPRRAPAPSRRHAPSHAHPMLAAPAIGMIAVAGVAVAVAADLATIGVPFLKGATGDLSRIEHPQPPAIARLAEREPQFRVLAFRRDRFYSNDWIRWHAASLSGVHAAVPRAWEDLRRAGLLPRYGPACAFAVRYLFVDGIDDADSSQFERAAVDRDGIVWRLKAARPRAHAVSRIVSLGDEDAVLAALGRPEYDPARVAFTSEAAAAGEYPGSAGARLRWLEDEPDRLALVVEAPAPAFVVVADAFFPGWTARIDGRATAIFRVNHFVRGVAVPAGRHRIGFAYAPEGWDQSRGTARLAFLIWILLGSAWVAVALARRSRTRTTALAAGRIAGVSPVQGS